MHREFWKVLLLGLIHLGARGVLSGGVNVWTGAGPEGGIVQSILMDPIDPSTLYAATQSAGIFKSINGGGSWTPINNGLLSSRADVLVASRPSTIYAGVFPGVYRSTNGGATWSDVSNGLPVTFVYDLATTSAAPSTVYAALDSEGVFKTANGGETWASVGLAGRTVTALAISESAPTTVYAGTYAHIFKTTNGGGMWVDLDTGVPSPDILDLVIDPGSPATVYAAACDLGVLKSTDGGNNWFAASAGLPSTCVRRVMLDPRLTSTVYVGTNDGVFVSSNGGGLWSPFNSGLNYMIIYSLAANAGTPATLYCGTLGAGVFRTVGGTGDWVSSNSGLVATQVDALATDPANTSVVYAGVYGGGVYKSTDSGQTWTAVRLGLTSMFPTALAVDTVDPATLYAGARDGLGGVFKSTNGGVSWFPVNNGLYPVVNDVAIDPAAPSTLYAGTEGAGIFKTVDGGASWNAVNVGLANGIINAVAVSPSAPSVLYAGTYLGGVFKSIDGGGSWTNVGLPNIRIFGLGIDPTTASVVYVGTDAGTFKTVNGGATWAPICDGLYLDCTSYAIVVDPRSPSTVYAAASVGVFESSNAGQDWTLHDPGQTLPWGSVQELVLGPGGGWLHAASGSRGVFSLQEVPPLSFFTVTPCRMLDTRLPDGPLGGPPLLAGTPRSFTVVGQCGIPSDALAISVNITIANPTSQGHLTLYPDDSTPPGVSAINFGAGQTRANNAILLLGPAGGFTVSCFQASLGASVQFILDVNGYFGSVDSELKPLRSVGGELAGFVFQRKSAHGYTCVRSDL